MVNNGISIDVEEWFHVCVDVGMIGSPAIERVAVNIERLLDLLSAVDVKATFFTLGSVAEALPRLVPRIAAAGHEVASHGWSHSLVTDLGPSEFRSELQRTNKILSDQSGMVPQGFRAPRWSLSRQETPWAFDILVEEGFVYDSSCTPLAGIGNPRGPCSPHLLTTSSGPLWEIPPLVTPTPFTNLPTGGGWGFRFFSLALIEHSMQALNAAGQPAVLFVHPREVDPTGPRVPLSWFRSFVTYGSKRDVAPRLKYLLQRHRFVPLIELVKSWPVA